MEQIKEILRKLLRPLLEKQSVKNYLFKRLLDNNFKEDARLYKAYSVAFNTSGIKNKEADLILNYHSLEKGMLFQTMKKGFGEYRVRNLHRILNDPEIIKGVDRSQIRVGYQVMCQYYEIHQQLGFDLAELYTSEQYSFYKSVLSKSYSSDFSGVVNWTKDNFYVNGDADFRSFAFSRKSVRDFTGEKVAKDTLKEVIRLANTAPSVCNRQASNVYLVEDKKKIDRILAIQGGFSGYTENVSQLLILTNDRRYYYTVGERSQLFIDGGLYLMNLLYALHFYKIGNCPANWGKTVKEEAPLDTVIDIPKSEKIICLIPIGVVQDEFRTTLSLRRPDTENFIIID
jgi:nitroreductase